MVPQVTTDGASVPLTIDEYSWVWRPWFPCVVRPIHLGVGGASFGIESLYVLGNLGSTDSHRIWSVNIRRLTAIFHCHLNIEYWLTNSEWREVTIFEADINWLVTKMAKAELIQGVQPPSEYSRTYKRYWYFKTIIIISKESVSVYFIIFARTVHVEHMSKNKGLTVTHRIKTAEAILAIYRNQYVLTNTEPLIHVPNRSALFDPNMDCFVHTCPPYRSLFWFGVQRFLQGLDMANRID